MKISIVFLLLLTSPFAAVKKKKRVRYKLEVSYSESANVFEVLDNISNWWGPYVDPVYLGYWQEKKNSLEKDQQFFDQYKKLREKYFKKEYYKEHGANSGEGLFARRGSLVADPLAAIFFKNSTIDNALKDSLSLIDKAEALFLQDFYLNFKERISPWIAESVIFQQAAKNLQKHSKKMNISSHLKKVAKFYNVDYKQELLAKFVWYPPVSRAGPSFNGGHLLLKYNPIKHLEDVDIDVLLQEFTHVYSSLQGQSEKLALSKQFLAKCSWENKARIEILESPLALAVGRMLYYKMKLRKKFEYMRSWSRDPWIDIYSRVLLPLVEGYFAKNHTIHQGFMSSAGDLCKNLKSAGKSL